MDRERKKTDKDKGSNETNNSQTCVNSTSSDGGTNTVIAYRGNIAEGAGVADRYGGLDLHVVGFSGRI